MKTSPLHPTVNGLLLFAILWAFLSSSIAINAAQSGDFTYATDGSTITITGYTGPGGNVIIPDTLAGKPVISIGGAAFQGLTGLTSVTIPNSVTNIGGRAFRECAGLISVTIPNSVTSIEDSAFFGCTGLTSVTIPNSVTNIGGGAFRVCTGLISVTIPNSVTNIGDGAFDGCTALTSVSIPNSVTNIGEGAFRDCTGLSAITVDALNPSYSSTDGVLFSKRQDILTQYPGGKVGSYTIPNSVTSIQNFAFFGCTGLTSVIIPKSVTSIGWATFGNCTELSSVSIPNSVTSVRGTFFGCTGLTSVNIPNSVTTIGYRAFYSCTGLTGVTIPNSVTSIANYAFENCTGLTSVHFNGKAPAIVFGMEWPSETVFSGADKVIVYHLAGTTGWDTTFSARPTAVWVDQPSYGEWAQSFGLATKYPNASAEQEDADQDGLTNIQEMAAGTDPANGKSALIIEQQSRPGDLSDGDKTPMGPDQFALYFQTIPGKTYEIQSTEILGAPWKTEATVIAATTQKRILMKKPAQNGFYRVMLGQ